MRSGGCPVCAVRARSERATLDAIINERVLDIIERARRGHRLEPQAVAPFCLDDFIALWATAGSHHAFEPVARRQLARFADLRRRLDGFAQPSSHDRYPLDRGGAHGGR